MFDTGEIVGLAEWIIDDICLDMFNFKTNSNLVLIIGSVQFFALV